MPDLTREQAVELARKHCGLPIHRDSCLIDTILAAHKQGQEARDTAAPVAWMLWRAFDGPPRFTTDQKGAADMMTSRADVTVTPLYDHPPMPPKLWLWKNFVGGRPEFWAFDNPFPIHLNNGDPQTLGEPCGYALLKPSRVGRTDVSEAEVLRRIAAAKDVP